MNNPLKSLLRQGKFSLGSWITLAHHSIPEIMARAGFDWLTVDMEHSVIDFGALEQTIQVIELCGVVPLVRLTENQTALIKRAMDAGAYGVIVPMVNSPEEAERAVAAVRYPPLGTRGVGLARAQGYGQTFDAYAQTINEQSVVIAQIEHVRAVEQIDRILAVDGIDGYLIGPYDLSASLGVPGHFDDPRVQQAQAQCLAAAVRAGKVAGIHVVQPDPEAVRARQVEGYRLIAVGLDTLFLGNSCRRVVQRIREGVL